MRHRSVHLTSRALLVGALAVVACLLAAADGTATVLAEPAAQPTHRLLLGHHRLIGSIRRSGAGTAQAFRFLAPASGSVRAISVYVGARSSSRTLIAGLYTSRGGRPRSLLASSSAPVRRRGRWMTIDIRRTRVVRGRAYWIAMMGTGGALEIRAHRSAGCRSAIDRVAPLRDLPRSWRAGTTRATCVSAYTSGSRTTSTGVGTGPTTQPAPSPVSDPTSPPITSPVPPGTSPPTVVLPRTGQSVAFWLAWSGSIRESQIPWNAVTQVDLFALTTNTNTSSCTSDCTTLNTSLNGLSRMNVASWVSTIHQQGKLAIISIGGSTDQDWIHACAPANLPGFASELTDYMVSNGFDGVDIDIEALQGSGAQLSLWASCVQAISQAAHAATTQAGKTPIVSTDVDQSWMDSAVSKFEQWPDQFNLMYYGYPTGSYSCANSCSQVNSLVQGLHNTGHVPYDEMVLGMSPGGGQAQCCYTDLATTTTGVDTGATVSSISLSSGLSSALPAGNVVLATGEDPPTHYEIFSTSGAAQGATSIPITGEVSGSGAYLFGAGSEVQSDYAGPWDCGNFARYAASAGLEGVMIWDLQEEAVEHGGQFPCFAQVAPYVMSPP
jgi:hypothetical protein